MIDVRGIPTCSCPNCGGEVFRLLASFDKKTYTVLSYWNDMQCHDCGALCTAPTPMSHPDYPDNMKRKDK
jgi:hypothetical protein